MKLFVTGGTGLIGKKLLPRLVEEGHRVMLLTRDPSKFPAQNQVEPIQGDAAIAGPWLERLDEAEAVIHLAGEPIFGRRWSRRFKQLLRDSRVNSTKLIAERLARSPKPLLCGSAVGIYGHDVRDDEFDENSPAGNDFLAEVCKEWEAAAQPAVIAGCRTVWLRTGIVLDPAGGALKTMARPFKWFVGGVIASGKQWMSWIHSNDMVNLILFALNDSKVTGPLNCVSPEPVKNWGFCKTLARVLSRPCWFPTPGFMLRIVVGQAAQIVTRGQRVSSRKAEQLGYRFQFSDLETALRDLYQRPARTSQ
jgi:uncharacterized protein (TIGR01777 family)